MNRQNNNFETLDLLTIISFLAQVENINKDAEEKNYIHSVIKAISAEIEKLHKENNKLELKIDKILEILKEREDNI